MIGLKPEKEKLGFYIFKVIWLFKDSISKLMEFGRLSTVNEKLMRKSRHTVSELACFYWPTCVYFDK